MDLLYHRYADPISLLDRMINAGQLSEFIDVIMRKQNEEMEWQYYLHKVFDKSFGDFKRGLQEEEENIAASRDTFDLETTVKETMDIANLEFEERG